MPEKKFTIDDLSSLTGYSRRTIRYYIQIGLVEPPAGRGRGGFYNDSHLNKLRQIKVLNERGMSLSAIINYLEGGGIAEESYQRDVWVKYEISPGIEFVVRKDVDEEKKKKIFEIVKVAKSVIREES